MLIIYFLLLLSPYKILTFIITPLQIQIINSLFVYLMDYIFGSNQDQYQKSIHKQKQLKQSIFIKQNHQSKQLTPLQFFKLQQKKKLTSHHQHNQFAQIHLNDQLKSINISQTKQPKHININMQNHQFQSEKQIKPITLSRQITPYNSKYQSTQHKPLSPQLSIQNNNSIKQNSSINKINLNNKPNKVNSPPKLSKQNSNGKKIILKKQISPLLNKQMSPSNKQKQISMQLKQQKQVKQIKQPNRSISKLKQVKQVNQTNSAKQISPSKRLGQIKQIKSAKQISPTKQIKQSKQIKPDINIIKLNNNKNNNSLSNNKNISLSNNKNNNSLLKDIQIKNDKQSLNKQIKTLQAKKIQQKQKQIKQQRLIKQQKINKKQLISKQQPKSIRQSIKQLKQSKQQQYEQKQVQYSLFNESIDPQQHLNINQLLQGQLSISQRGLKFLDKKLISDQIIDVQNHVFNALTSQRPNQYLKGQYQNIYPDNQFIKGQVNHVVNNALSNINKLIQQPKYNNGLKISIEKKNSPKHRDDLKQLQKLDKYRLIKIKQGQVKNKVGDLRHQLEKQYFNNKNFITVNPQDILDSKYYAIDHPQTLKAQQLIKEIHKKRKSQHKHYKQYLDHKQLQKQRIHQIQKQYQQMYNQQKKQKLRQFYQQKHHQRQLHKQQLKKKQQEFKDWIKMYQRQKPLEEKLQEQMVMKFIIPEIQDRHKKLMKIKQLHKPIDIEDINQHDHRYMEYKRDQHIRQKAQVQNKLENDHMNQDQVSRLYKGKYRYLVLQSMYEEKNQTDPKDIQRSKKQRQLAYSDQVRYVHQSLIKKKHQAPQDARSLLRRVRNHNGSVDSGQSRLNKTIDVTATEGTSQRHVKRDAETIDTYAQGLKNLQYVKSHVREKLMNGQEKKPKIQFIEEKQHFKDYLADLREQRLHNSLPHKQKDHSEQLKNRSSVMNGKSRNSMNDSIMSNEMQNLRAKVDNLDERVKRKEMKHRIMRDNSRVMDSKLQDEYLQSINAKIKLVQQLK